jgi:tRNA nucleotidyltransferase (CCA-adding enzyme)
VRFAVRYQLAVEDTTEQAMKALSPLMDNLARERVFDELCKLLPLISASQLQQYAPILCAVIPELAPMVGFDQRTVHHAYDLFTHTAQVVEHIPADLTLRWTALLHDIGKVPTLTLDENGHGHYLGHAKKSAEMADLVLHRLKAPTALREQVVWLIDHHMSPLEPKRNQLRRQLSRWGQQALEQLLALQRADYSSKGTGTPEEAAVFDEIAALLNEILAEKACLSLKDMAVNGRDLLELGFTPGKELGNCLNHLFRLVLEETIPNHRETLLKQAIIYKENAL